MKVFLYGLSKYLITERYPPLYLYFMLSVLSLVFYEFETTADTAIALVAVGGSFFGLVLVFRHIRNKYAELFEGDDEKFD